MMWAIIHGSRSRVMRLHTFVKSMRVSFVRLTSSMCFAETLFAPECHDHQARHIYVRQKRCHSAYEPQSFAEALRNARRSCAPSLPQNLVFREEAGKKRKSADCKPPDQHRRKRYGHVLAQPTHAPHVLFMVRAVNHR